MGTLAKWIRHNQGLFVTLFVTVVTLAWVYGCESRVSSMLEPHQQISREELKLELVQESTRLQNELVLIQKQAELRFAKLDKDDEIKRQLVEFAALVTATGGVNPAGVLALLTGIVGVGAVIDNRIKDKVIKNRPLKVT